MSQSSQADYFCISPSALLNFFSAIQAVFVVLAIIQARCSQSCLQCAHRRALTAPLTAGFYTSAGGHSSPFSVLLWTSTNSIPFIFFSHHIFLTSHAASCSPPPGPAALPAAPRYHIVSHHLHRLQGLCSGSNTPQINCVLKTSRQRKKRRVSSAHTPAGLQLWEAPILTERRCTAPPREQNINPCSSPWKRSEDPLRRGCGPRRATAAVGYSSVSLTDEAAGDVFAAEPGAQERSAARL